MRLKKSVKKVLIIAAIAIVAIAAIITAIILFLNRPKKTKKPSLPVETDVRGNTSGNILNGANFCEYKGHIYFSNPMDGGTLYRMDNDGSNITRLSQEIVSNINIINDRIYYTKKTTNIAGGKSYGICSTSLNGHDVVELTSNIIVNMVIEDNVIYYKGSDDKTFNYIFAYDLKKKEEKKVSDTPFDVCSIQDGKIYYAGDTNNHSIWYYDVKANRNALFHGANAYKVLNVGEYTYYIDLDTDYSLVRINTATKKKEVIYEGSKEARCLMYNVYDNIIFYYVQGENGSLLFKINTDDMKPQMVVGDYVNGIYCTSTLTFVTVFNSTKVYQFNTRDEYPIAKLLTAQ